MIDTGQYEARVQPTSSKEQQEQAFANQMQRMKEMEFERKQTLYSIAALLRDAMILADDILETDLKLDIIDVRRRVSVKLENIVAKNAG